MPATMIITAEAEDRRAGAARGDNDRKEGRFAEVIGER